MKHTIVMIIEDGNLQKVEACAFSKNSANIYIYAGSFLQAQNLLQQGKELATQAVQNWKPEDTQNEAPALDPKQFYVNKSSYEENQKAAQEYESSLEGKRFIKRLEEAKKFLFRQGKNCIYIQQLNYLSSKYFNNLIDGSLDLIALAYKKGYTDGKTATKKRKDPTKC